MESSFFTKHHLNFIDIGSPKDTLTKRITELEAENNLLKQEILKLKNNPQSGIQLTTK